MNRKIGIIGHFGGKHNFLDGQTVKTKVFYEELKKRGFSDITCVDTYLNKMNKISLLIKSLRCLMSCDIIIVLLSKNGLKTYLPLLYATKKIRKCRIYHNVIGGHLHTDISSLGKNAAKYLNSIDANWVETVYMKNKLEEVGITNCDIFTNFKAYKPSLKPKDLSSNGQNRFAVFSRIIKEKGVSDAIEAIANYNKLHDKKIHLDIWGAVGEDYKEEFERLVSENSDCVHYSGLIEFNNGAEVLSEHIALLFPTHFSGEGCPGTLIDAYAASLPVISSRWDAADEMIKPFETGWVYPNEKIKTLEESIEYAMEHQEEMLSMRKNCLLLSTRYTADFVMRRLIEKYFKE